MFDKACGAFACTPPPSQGGVINPRSLLCRLYLAVLPAQTHKHAKGRPAARKAGPEGSSGKAVCDPPSSTSGMQYHHGEEIWDMRPPYFPPPPSAVSESRAPSSPPKVSSPKAGDRASKRMMLLALMKTRPEPRPRWVRMNGRLSFSIAGIT